MQLGSDLYDLAPSYGTTLSRPSDPQPKNLPSNAPGTETTFLAQANDAAGIMMTENTIAGHLSLVPASSSSKTHIELVRHVGQQHVKHSRMKVLDEIVDPEKAFMVQNTKKKVTNRKPGGGGGRAGGARKKADSSDDEDEDPRFTYDTDLPGGRGRPPKQNEAEYEDDGFVIADSDEEDEAEEEEGDDDAAYGSSKKSKKSKSKSKKRKGSEGEEMDEMELAEKRIEAAEREKKRAKRDRNRRRAYDTDESEVAGEAGGDGDGEEDMEMDVESD